ncbi:MAG: response regulator [Myxococcales bacterium]|nr:response regulator [Myxococcales bacterium]
MLATIMLVLALDFRNRSTNARRDLLSRTEAVIAAVEYDIARLAYEHDRELAVDIVRRLESFGDLERLHAYRPDGTVLLAYQKPAWLGTALPAVPTREEVEFTDDRLVVSANMGGLAAVRAHANVASVQAAERTAIQTGAILGIFLALIGVGAVLLLQRTVVRRIRGLEQTAAEVVRSGDYSIRADTGSSDELGTIADGVNSLLETVEQTLEEKLETERQLHESQKLDSLGRLAGGVAHDFNNLLTVILARASMIQQRHGDSGAELIVEAAQRASELTRQLLSFSRKAVVERKHVELGELLRELERLLEHVIPENIAVEVRPDPQIWGVLADPGRLQQVLLNLAINARDAMPEGGRLTLDARNLELDSDGHADTVEIRVADTGHGMDPHTLARALEPFFTTKADAGTGLGLAVAYGILKQFGGDLEIASEPGSGTVVRVRLPRSEGESDITATGGTGSVSAGSGTILLVEDEALVRDSTEALLAESGYRVITACDGEAALEHWQSCASTIDLLIADMVMPKQSGLDLARTMRSERPELPVLLTSGYTDDGSLDQLRASGRFAFQPKPYTRAELLKSVETLIHPA